MGPSSSPEQMPTASSLEQAGSTVGGKKICRPMGPNGNPKIKRLDCRLAAGWGQAGRHKIRRHISPNGNPKKTYATSCWEQAGSRLASLKHAVPLSRMAVQLEPGWELAGMHRIHRHMSLNGNPRKRPRLKSGSRLLSARLGAGWTERAGRCFNMGDVRPVSGIVLVMRVGLL